MTPTTNIYLLKSRKLHLKTCSKYKLCNKRSIVSFSKCVSLEATVVADISLVARFEFEMFLLFSTAGKLAAASFLCGPFNQ